MATMTIDAPQASSVSELDVNELIEQHLYLVDHIVHQLAARFPRHVDRDELHSAGATGLVDAAHRYEAETGVPFARYASIRIRGAVIDATRARDWATRRLRRDLREIEATTSRLEESLQRRPEDAEIAAAMGTDEAAIRDRRRAAVTATVLTLDRPAGGEEERTSLGDQLAEEDGTWLPEAALERNELVGTLRTAMAQLPALLQQVLVEHHFEGRLLRDIADDLGVTEARASQLRYEAIHALQAYFATTYDGVPAVPDSAPGKRRRAAFVAQVAANATWRSRLEGAGTPLATGAQASA